jgi:hypothetical protein
VARFVKFLTTGLSHDNFSSVYWIFTKLDHMIALWKGKNPIYVGVKGQGHYKYNFKNSIYSNGDLDL